MANLPKYTRPRRLPEKKRVPTSDQSFYNSTAWRTLRVVHLHDNPLCEVCLASNKLVDCTFGGHIDHIAPISDGGAKLRTENLMTLCPTCHHRKSGIEQHEQCLVKTRDVEGELIPGDGEKERLIQRLSKYLA